MHMRLGRNGLVDRATRLIVEGVGRIVILISLLGGHTAGIDPFRAAKLSSVRILIVAAGRGEHHCAK
jgi:hypothetical protein